jgi:DNA-binding response OmpR family regulator
VRVLLVEDEASQQEALGIVLTATGYTVLPAMDVRDALASLDAHFDAAILDVRLPDPDGLSRDGFTVLHALRAKHPDLPVAVFTGVPLSDTDTRVAHDHNATVLYKPQSFDTILEFLATHARRI